MAITISDKLKLNRPMPNLDSRYGPYSSLEEAHELLGPDGADLLCIGLTVGIQTEDDGPIVEYWYRDGIEFADLIHKVPVDEEFSETSANPISNAALTKRLSGIDSAISGLDTDTDKQIEEINQSISKLTADTSERMDEIDASVAALDEKATTRMDSIDQTVSALDSSASARMDGIDATIKSLDSSTGERMDEIDATITEFKSDTSAKLAELDESKQDNIAFATAEDVAGLFAEIGA